MPRDACVVRFVPKKKKNKKKRWAHSFALTPSPLPDRVDDARDALEVKEALSAEGIMVRHYSKPASISGCIRVSVGKPEQTDLLQKALSKV